jgi:hypothetical protein
MHDADIIYFIHSDVSTYNCLLRTRMLRYLNEIKLPISEKFGLVNNMTKTEETIKNHKMTLDEHREQGRILQDARNMLVVNRNKLANIYGNTKDPNLKLGRAADLIDEVRSLLDDKLFDEYPALESEEGCRYYY